MPLHSAPSPKPYKNAVVLYYWRQCGHCKTFAPVFDEVVAVLPADVDIYSIEVFDHRRTLEKLGVNLNTGVPRLLVYDQHGKEHVFQDERTVEAVVNFVHTVLNTHSGFQGGHALSDGVALNAEVMSVSDVSSSVSGGSASVQSASVQSASVQSPSVQSGSVNTLAAGTSIESLLTSLEEVLASPTPTLVLFFSHGCYYCKKFMPTFLEFTSNSPPPGITIKAIDVAQHPDALMSLQKKAQSPGVPHVVFFQSGKPQVPFTKDRTVEQLTAFVAENMSLQGGNRDQLQGENSEGRIGFADTPKRSSIRLLLSAALDSLMQQASEDLGDANRKLFEPKHAGVCFVGWQRQSVPANDRLVIVLIPKHSSVEQTEDVMSEAERRKFPIFAVISGKRSGPLKAQVYNSLMNPATLINRKLKAQYRAASQTDAATQAMHDMQYKVRVDDGSSVCVFD